MAEGKEEGEGEKEFHDCRVEEKIGESSGKPPPLRVGEGLRALAAGVVEDLFAEAEGLGGDLEVLVFGEIF
jgi:hypothetical protein